MSAREPVLDSSRITAIETRELTRFRQRTAKAQEFFARSRELMPNGVPCSWMSSFYPGMQVVAAKGAGAWFEDIDGNRYLDMSQCDLSMSCGFGPEVVAEAVAERFRNGSHFLLASEDSLVVCQLLKERFGMPAWQFTLSASTANVEAIRIARFATRRDKILIFDGKYHGHIDETLVVETPDGAEPEHVGLPGDIVERTLVVPFNDLDAVRRALQTGEIACVLTEPVMTNCGVIYPDDGFLAELRDLTRRSGTLLIIDEAHTQVAAYGGFTRAWSLAPDLLTLGKSLGGGIALGAYGISAELKALIERNSEPLVEYEETIALGGTTYGSALAMTAARAALTTVLTEAAYDRLKALGTRLADGIDAVLARYALPWRAQRLGNRSGVFLSNERPRNSIEALSALSRPLNLAQRAFMANRGIWEPIYIHGPSLSFAHGGDEVAAYLEAFEEWIGTLAKEAMA